MSHLWQKMLGLLSERERERERAVVFEKVESRTQEERKVDSLLWDVRSNGGQATTPVPVTETPTPTTAAPITGPPATIEPGTTETGQTSTTVTSVNVTTIVPPPPTTLPSSIIPSQTNPVSVPQTQPPQPPSAALMIDNGDFSQTNCRPHPDSKYKRCEVGYSGFWRQSDSLAVGWKNRMGKLIALLFWIPIFSIQWKLIALLFPSYTIQQGEINSLFVITKTVPLACLATRTVNLIVKVKMCSRWE